MSDAGRLNAAITKLQDDIGAFMLKIVAVFTG
jgi:type III secretory pathway component EscS